MNINVQLLVAALLSFTASALHVATIFGGANWYRFLGAGEEMARLAEIGNPHPTIVTTAIAIILFIWGLYALSGAGVIFTLPLLKPVLVIVTFVYMLRGIMGLVLPFCTNHPFIAQNSFTFWLISSTICLVIGLFHLLGLIKSWQNW